ncbi:MAG: FKBP-type peptidyl-prolyl cis-trans isomerase [bacterium]|nr:FKBP-type peptidyl-prolyl cis-trans isomerase [bacterium]
MKPTQTGIAITLALVVIAVIFIFPGLSPFPSASTPAAVDAGLTTNEQPASTTMLPDSLQVSDEVVGTGAEASAGDTVTVNYVGSLADGSIFDASANHGTTGFTFVLGAGQVIKGWDEGVAGMQEGGKRTLVIPPALAYGDQGIGNVIPPAATLTFEVELVKVQKGSAAQ